MISDYLEQDTAFPKRDNRNPALDMWGTVLAASDDTREGNVRVKVKIMKDRMDIFDNVPVITGYGGKDHGAFCLPEEGDIVRLVFPGGDFRHPVVTGCRFPEDSQLVKDMYKDGKARQGFRAKNGSGMLFTGEQGKENIEISGSQNMAWKLDEENQKLSFGDKDQKNHMLLDKKNGKAQILSQESLRLECGKSCIELKKDGTITLQCEQLTLEAKTIKIQGKSQVQVKGQELTLEGATGILVTGRGNVKVSSKGPLKLSGAMIDLN
ncbi:MAG: phage baseplate assembly protein V [Lachnospiraceae bacterium]|nr:phage baseplate assembly protein V [Lachnospiraceae bacterium]MCM1239404.1 phage baseplate assembly protein V [Lachnospiraceae bacterium]